jgi:hypothetical protein
MKHAQLSRLQTNHTQVSSVPSELNLTPISRFDFQRLAPGSTLVIGVLAH